MVNFLSGLTGRTISFSRRWVEVLGVIGLVAILTWLFIFFNADHRYPPCCDTAVTMMKAKVLVQEQSFSAVQRFNPSYATPLYGSIISSEIVLHLVLAGAYALHQPWMYDLAFAKHFFLLLFLLPGCVFYALGRRFLGRPIAGLLFVLLVYLSFWFGNAYWTGHVAEFLGFGILAGIILILDRAYQTASWRPMVVAWGLLVVLFFTHVLAFMVALGVVAVTSLLLLRKVIPLQFIGGVYVAAIILFALYLKFLPIETTLVPSFGFNHLVFNFPGILAMTLGGAALHIFFFIGALRTLLDRRIVLLTWFIVSYLLSQSTLLGASFFSYRFNEFIVLPIIAMVVLGLLAILRLFPRRVTQIAIILVLLTTYIPFTIRQQNQLKQCYVQNCAGLSPTQILSGDLDAFRWLSENVDPDSRILAYQKFGYYLPVVTDLSAEFPEIDKAKIYTSTDASERHAIAKKYGIDYIFWDAVFAEQNNQITEAPGYSLKPFGVSTLFKKIYDAHGAHVYQVL